MKEVSVNGTIRLRARYQDPGPPAVTYTQEIVATIGVQATGITSPPPNETIFINVLSNSLSHSGSGLNLLTIY